LYAACGALLIAIAAEFLRNGLAGLATNSMVLLSFVTIVLLALAVTQMAALRDSINQLSEKSRFSIRYFDARHLDGVRELHRQAGRVIQRAPANAQIFAVNSYVEVFSNGDDATSRDPQREYLKEFERRFSEISYHRLIQLPDGGRAEGPLAELLTPAYLAHYREMVSFAGNGSVKLEEVPATIPTSFVLVKHGQGGEVIWQIHRHNPEVPDAMQILGIFIIRDPDGIVIPHFVNWFQVIDSRQATVVQSQDLDESA
jgi:hypothetical protein